MLSRLHGQFVRVLVFVAAAALPAAAHDTIQVAQDEAGKLVGHAHFDDVVVYLPESVFPGFDGFAGPDPGVEALIEDDPDEGLFVLPSTVNIELVLISADPVMRVWNGSAFLAPGDALVLGAPYFHLHPVWNATPDAQIGATYGMTFSLRDTTGTLADSDPFRIDFSPIPEPGAGLLLLWTLAFLRRR